jgi:dethiobiotin synthetase
MSKQLFITGTGTDVGKTYVTGLLVKKLKDAGKKVAYYKAAMSGNERDKNQKLIPGDALYVKQIAKIDQTLEEMCPYIYENAVSPHLASRLEGNPVKMSVVIEGFQKVCDHYDYVFMEGSGGILCPICFDEERIQLEDIIGELKLSSLIVADARLGTINAVVLTVEYMKARNLPILGLIFNHYPGDVMEEDNIKMCERMTGLRTIACVKDDDTEIDIDETILEHLFEEEKHDLVSL